MTNQIDKAINVLIGASECTHDSFPALVENLLLGIDIGAKAGPVRINLIASRTLKIGHIEITNRPVITRLVLIVSPTANALSHEATQHGLPVQGIKPSIVSIARLVVNDTFIVHENLGRNIQNRGGKIIHNATVAIADAKILLVLATIAIDGEIDRLIDFLDHLQKVFVAIRPASIVLRTRMRPQVRTGTLDGGIRPCLAATVELTPPARPIVSLLFILTEVASRRINLNDFNIIILGLIVPPLEPFSLHRSSPESECR